MNLSMVFMANTYSSRVVHGSDHVVFALLPVRAAAQVTTAVDQDRATLLGRGHFGGADAEHISLERKCWLGIFVRFVMTLMIILTF